MAHRRDASPAGRFRSVAVAGGCRGVHTRAGCWDLRVGYWTRARPCIRDVWEGGGMIRFVLGLCGYVPASRLEAMRDRARVAELHLRGTQNFSQRCNEARVTHALRIAALESELTTLRAQLPNRDKSGKFTRRI